MDEILILNGSPRAPRSNSLRYAKLFADCWPGTAHIQAVTAGNHLELCREVGRNSRLLLVFPLYADSIPVTLLNFLKTLEENPPENKPTVSVLINCGFLEWRQNDTAVQMVELFCRQNGYPFGSVLELGSGEAILDSPFRGIAARRIKKLAAAVAKGESRRFHGAMPLTKGLFLRAADSYWVSYGKKFGVTREQMETMEIEGGG